MSEPRFKPNTKSEPGRALLPPKRGQLKVRLFESLIKVLASLKVNDKVKVNDKASGKFITRPITLPASDDVINLSTDGELVSRLQLVPMSRLCTFSAQPPALPPEGEILEPPLALSSSQLPSTSIRGHLGGQDRSGSSTSHSQNERTRDQPEGRKRKIKNLTIEDLRPYVLLPRAQAAKELQMSESSFKRLCRRLKIEQWPKLPPGVIIPPDQNGEENPSPMFITQSNNGQITTENEMGGQNLELNEHLQESWRDGLASVERHLMGSPSVPTNPHTPTLLTERQDSTLVKVNATYGKHTIKLRLPLTSGITELKQVVSKQLKLGLDSFEVNYKDEHGEWILITLDEEVREHLQLTLSENQVNKLWVVNKVPNTTDFCCNCECDKCRSFKGNRP